MRTTRPQTIWDKCKVDRMRWVEWTEWERVRACGINLLKGKVETASQCLPNSGSVQWGNHSQVWRAKMLWWLTGASSWQPSSNRSISRWSKNKLTASLVPTTLPSLPARKMELLPVILPILTRASLETTMKIESLSFSTSLNPNLKTLMNGQGVHFLLSMMVMVDQLVLIIWETNFTNLL